MREELFGNWGRALLFLVYSLISEGYFLNDHQKIKLSRIFSEQDVGRRLTSVEFGTRGAVDEDLVFMCENSKCSLKYKTVGEVGDLKIAYNPDVLVLVASASGEMFRAL